MKYIDAFLKKLKTDRNTFLTYILVLISAYIVIDRLIEIIFIAATGMSLSYWGPIQYTLAIACLVFALWFSFASKFVKYNEQKLTYLYIFATCFYIVVAAMVIQWINKLEWILFFCVPNYTYIIVNFYELIRPAFSAIAWYIPVTTAYPVVFKKLYTVVRDSYDVYNSVYDCGGIDLSNHKDGYGPYTCEMYFTKDYITGKSIKTPESRRYESTLVVGVSGAGKTSMIFEPMIAKDMEKKFFYRESAKELGYTALKTGIAKLDNPYSNEYLNDNFNLNILVPAQNKEKLFKSYMSKMVLYESGDECTYRNLGITYIAPDAETIDHMTAVADNFKLNYHIIDPGADAHSTTGLNPFVYDDPKKAAIAISTILREMYVANFDIELSSVNIADTTLGEQAIENLVILLKLIFPKINSGAIPTLEDLLECINDFDLVEKMGKVLEEDPDLSEEYSMQIKYLKNTFYKKAPNRESIKNELKIPASQIEELLRYPGVRNILCNRTHNLNYDKALAEGEIVFICTRRSELGASLQRGFGLFCILLMQQSVLSRPGIEKSRIPHFLYIDEFPPYITSATKDIFTLYRKYRVGTIISAQNLSQFGADDDSERSSFRQTILANCSTEIVFGNNTPEDDAWWEKEFGDERRWQFTNNYHTVDNKQGEGMPGYDESYNNISLSYTRAFKSGKIQSLKFKQIIVKTKDIKGNNVVAKGKVDFLESKYKEPAKIKTYNFSKYIPNVNNNKEQTEEEDPTKIDLKNIDFTALSGTIGENDINPIIKSNKTVFKGSGDVDPIKDSRRKKNDNNN